jgi:hypothetical protein
MIIISYSPIEYVIINKGLIANPNIEPVQEKNNLKPTRYLNYSSSQSITTSSPKVEHQAED